MVQTFILGIVQGLTEFLPISSSGHLVLFQHLFGMNNPGFTLEIILHLGTLLSVLIYFRKKIWRLIQSLIKWSEPSLKKERSFVGFIILAMIPTGILGLTLKSTLEAAKNDLTVVGSALIFTSLLLFSANIMMKKRKGGPLSWLRALLIGIGQGFAVIPGVSRSGATLTTALMTGVDREEAAEYSFILSIPAILAAFLLDFEPGNYFTPELLLGMLAAFVSGLLAIHIFLILIRKAKLHFFGYYCLFVGIIISLFL